MLVNITEMERIIYLTAGLGYGDEGKGTTVDWLSSINSVKSIWRYNGGAQAAHHVVSEKDTLHCFAQFGSGSLSSPVSTYLSRYVAINPLSLAHERLILTPKMDYPLPPVLLAAEALVITPYHSLINQIREIVRGDKRLGSCGRGVGETVREANRYPNEALRIKDLFDRAKLSNKLRFLQTVKVDEAEQLCDSHNDNPELKKRLESLRSEEHYWKLVDWYCDFVQDHNVQVIYSPTDPKLINADGDIVFEGAQGALLHRDYGFYPHVTQSDTSFQNAEKLIKEHGLAGKIVKIGILRGYTTRHGAGPLVTFDAELTKTIPDEHNVSNEWQGDFRLGWLDLLATRYALKITGKVDGIALTNLDRLMKLKRVKVCTAYEYSGSINFQDVAQYFVSYREAGHVIITDIKLPPPDHLFDPSERQKITDIINKCQPRYKTIEVTVNFIDTYIKFLEQQLDTEIRIISTGPKASDKKLLNP